MYHIASDGSENMQNSCMNLMQTVNIQSVMVWNSLTGGHPPLHTETTIKELHSVTTTWTNKEAEE